MQRDVQVNAVLEQVVCDTILQYDEVMEFRQRMQAHLEDGMDIGGCADAASASPAAQPAAAAQPSGPGLLGFNGSEAAAPRRYVTSLLQRVDPGTVQEVLSWQVKDWNAYVTSTAQELSILLQMTMGSSIGYQEERGGVRVVPHLDIAEQKLCQAVDAATTVGIIGAIYADKVGQQLGTCTSLNQVTLQQEAPPQHHWQHVLQQLQLTDQQLLQLAAGHRLFARRCKALQEAQLAVAHLVDTANSCNLQVLATAATARDSTAAAAAASGVAVPGKVQAHRATTQHTPAGGAAATPPATAQHTAPGSLPRDVGEPAGCSTGSAPCSTSSATLGSAVRAAAPAVKPGSPAAEGTGAAAGDAPADPVTSMVRLLRLWSQTTGLLHFLLLNSLTQQQIAQLAVVSFPYAPRPAPVMEAAHQRFMSGAKVAPAPPGCGGRGASGGLSPAPASGQALAHSMQRSYMLQQQVRCRQRV